MTERPEITEDEIQKQIKKVLARLSGKSVSKAVYKKLPNVKPSSKKDIIEKLNSAYLNENLVLVLGAGASINYGLPNWNELLQRLMVTTIEEEQNVSIILSKLFSSLFNPNPLIAARYLQKYYEDRNISFEEAVQKELYINCNYNIESELMTEIINFCVAPGKTPNLDSIITYNFDDVLEQKLSNVGIEIPFKPIYGIGINPVNGELPIFHVHGYLPNKGKPRNQNKITFGENIYHEQYNEVYSWNNITQINKFRDKTCLFIGSSLTDPNIRRLLDIAKLQKGKSKEFHYIFKLKNDKHKIKHNLKEILNKNKILLNEKNSVVLGIDKTVELLIDITERFEENDSASFGVKTIWVNKYNEIPEILSEIRK